MATVEVNNSHVMVLNFTKYFNLYTAILRIFIYSKHKIIHSKRPKDRIFVTYPQDILSLCSSVYYIYINPLTIKRGRS